MQRSSRQKVADEIIPSIRKTGAYQLKRLTPEEIMRIQLGMLDGHDARITKLENNMTLDYGQQKFWVILYPKELFIGLRERFKRISAGFEKGIFRVQ